MKRSCHGHHLHRVLTPQLLHPSVAVHCSEPLAPSTESIARELHVLVLHGLRAWHCRLSWATDNQRIGASDWTCSRSRFRNLENARLGSHGRLHAFTPLLPYLLHAKLFVDQLPQGAWRVSYEYSRPMRFASSDILRRTASRGRSSIGPQQSGFLPCYINWYAARRPFLEPWTALFSSGEMLLGQVHRQLNCVFNNLVQIHIQPDHVLQLIQPHR